MPLALSRRYRHAARGRVDLARLRANILWLSLQGVDGFVCTGISGEFLYLPDREREAVHRTVLDTACDNLIYPCTWNPNSETTRYITEAAQEQGATGNLMPPPLYHAPTICSRRSTPVYTPGYTPKASSPA
ncbi:MAG: hypothetical protein GWP91_22105 [Rhodobacterales bacterium]|nr:hypothetical protein [Rhodobacterales bacterium]